MRVPVQRYRRRHVSHTSRYIHRKTRQKRLKKLESVGFAVTKDPAFESAEKDYEVEAEFAEKVLADKAHIFEFPYYSSYVQTIDAESSLLPEPPRRLLFIGSGPVPLSAILYKQKFPLARVDILDIDPVALRVGGRVARKVGTPLDKEILGDAATIGGLDQYDAVVVALEAGPTDTAKRAVLNGLLSRVGPQTTLLVRGSPNVGGSEFVNTRKLLPTNAAVFGSVVTFDSYGETIAVRSVKQ